MMSLKSIWKTMLLDNDVFTAKASEFQDEKNKNRAPKKDGIEKNLIQQLKICRIN